MPLIAEQDNDYVVGVKGNQAKLLQQFKKAAVEQSPRCCHSEIERTRGRLVERSVKVFVADRTLTRDWAKAQSLIVVQRRGTRGGKPFEATS